MKPIIVITGKPSKMLRAFKEDTLDFLYHQEDRGEYKNTICSYLIDEIQGMESGVRNIYEKLSDSGKRRYNAILSELEHLVAEEVLEEENSPARLNADKILTQSDRCELFGALIDTVEDWLEEKGITVDDIPNDERVDEDSAIIYGSDYDTLADCFAEIIGIRRDVEDVSDEPIVLTAGVLKELTSGLNIPALKALTRGKKNDDVIHVFDENTYVATKLWSSDDVKGVLLEMGYKPSDKNVAAVLATNELRKLEGCTDEDWKIIRNAIKEAKDLELKGV